MSADITRVTGGAAGLEATYDAVRALADAFDRAGDQQRGWAGLGARVLTDPDLVASALLAPATFAVAEAAVVAATTGPQGLMPGSVGWEADALVVRAVLATLEASDDAARLALEVIDWRLGVLAGSALRIAGPALVPAAVTMLQAMPPATRARLDAAVQRWVVRHPVVVQHAVNAGGGLFTGLSPLTIVVPDNRTATALLAAAYDDGDPVTVRRPDVAPPARGRQPGSVASLIGHLSAMAALSPTPESANNGTIEVQSLDPGTDHARHVVYLPGTDDLGTRPWTQDDDLRDLGADLRSAADLPTAYQQGILDAMARAGIGAHEPVLLVGHSLGGMEAAALASRDTGFAITDVVTAGSPTAQVGGFPDGVRVLSLENHGDAVPLLDGADNRDSVEQTTVTFEDTFDPSVEGAHAYPHYLAGAAAVDASTDPSITEHLAGLRDRGFLDGPRPATQVTSQVFQIVRDR